MCVEWKWKWTFVWGCGDCTCICVCPRPRGSEYALWWFDAKLTDVTPFKATNSNPFTPNLQESN